MHNSRCSIRNYDYKNLYERLWDAELVSYVSNKIGKFTGAEVIMARPSAGRSSVLAALKKLTDEGIIIKMGSVRSTYYVSKDSLPQ